MCAFDHPVISAYAWQIIRLLALVLSCALLGTGCTGQEVGTEPQNLMSQARWIDNSATATLTLARNQRYEPFAGTLILTDTSTAYWIRLDLEPQRPVDSPWVLRLRSRGQSDIEIHREGNSSCAQPQTMEARQVAALRRSIVGWFTIPLCSYENRLYIRLHSDSEAFLQAKVLPQEVAESSDVFDAAAMYVLLGCLGLAALLAVGNSLAQRSILAASQLVQLAGFIAYLSAQLAPHVATRLADIGTYQARFDLRVWRLAMVLGLVVFLRNWLRSQQDASQRLWPMDALVIMLILALPLALAGQFQASETLSASAFILALPLALGSAVTARQRWSAGNTVSVLVVILGWASVLSIYRGVDIQSTATTTLLFHGLLGGSILMRQANSAREALRIATEQRLKADARKENRELFLMLAHELRTPLAVISLHVDSDLPSEAGKQRSRTAVRDMDNLIERCLQTARIEDAELPVELTELQVQEAVSATAKQWPDAGQLRVSVDPVLPAIRSNATLLNMVMGVLVDNATRYGESGAPVLLNARLSRDDDRYGVAITVTNALGPAGAPDPARVFQKYYRGAVAHHQTGAGLGLYLAARLVERLKAKLTLETNKDTVSFVLWLPC